ncbi:hypothetical protein [Legionella shakespearei]|uniref:Uncharacterized protein n=1 Tax=Legionella shakespearei DSM 23087 TaxID=1122169 RepID=A0A0W0YRM2_9GAMM|nr:hypothetical protein [Legionella shakespearei]KTD59294.1 hypothetical protein Lsha_1990 [Legionella shakespearei DSM 23087]
MQKMSFEIILALFLIKIIQISKKIALGQIYIQSELEEVCHQLKKNEKDFYHGF